MGLFSGGLIACVPESKVDETMKKALTIVLSDVELQELYRVILDRDEKGALTFLDRHLRGQVIRALEGG